MDHHLDPGRANRTAERHLRPHAAVCARRRAISCTRRQSASSCTGSDTTDTAYTNVELPGSDPPARKPRIRTRGIRGDAREDAWRDPCIARCVAGLRPSSWYTIGPCGYGVNAGERRSNQRDCLQHGASKDSPDLPTAHASDLPTPNNVSDVEESPHADIWRHCMHQEFDGLLEAGTFAPAPA